MQPFPRSLLAVARSQHGLIRTDDFRAHGVSQRQRSTALASGAIAVVHRGVYRLSSHEVTFEQRCLAACLAAPDAALSGPTAGRLFGLRKLATTDVHLIARRTIHLDGVVAHRTVLLDALDVQDRGLLRILRPARLACDLAAYVDDDDLESVIEQMLERRLVQLATLRQVARRFVACGREGSARIARVLDGRPTWRRPVGSDIELRLQRALERAGLRVVTQHRLILDSGALIALDLAELDLRFGIEVDHSTWHGGRLEVQRDKRRDREAMRLGWTIARVTDDDVEHRLNSTVDQLTAIAARLAQRPA